MMRLIVTEPVRVGDRRRDIGETIEVDPAFADELITRGLAADPSAKKLPPPAAAPQGATPKTTPKPETKTTPKPASK
jgi:hypothetical protein